MALFELSEMFLWTLSPAVSHLICTLVHVSVYVCMCIHVYEYGCFMYVHMCIYSVSVYFMTLHSAVRIPLVLICAIYIRFIIIINAPDGLYH